MQYQPSNREFLLVFGIKIFVGVLLIMIALIILLAFKVDWDNAVIVNESWEYGGKEASVLRHLERDCLKIFHGTSTLTGDKDNGWTIRCDYRKSEVLGQ